MEINNIIFDFGGVLIDWNPEYLYRNIFKDEKELKFFLNEICNPEWNLQQDGGRSFQEANKELIMKFPQYEAEIEKYYNRWIEMIGGEIHENTSLLKPLKTNYSLFGLTNWSAETFPQVYNKYSFFKEFEGIVVSGRERLTKPNPEIYKILTDRYSIIPEQSLFIDDNEENIKSARGIGFLTIHLEKSVILKKELEKLGIKIIDNRVQGDYY